MNADDIMIVGSHPLRLRLVLGLMEDAESPLETYRWATTALMHAFDTQDLTLREEVGRIMSAKSLTPYKAYKEAAPAGGRRGKYQPTRTMTEPVMRMQLKQAVEELMGRKDADGKPLFNLKNHWWAVYRLCIDYEVMGLKENRYKEFVELIDSLMLLQVNAELDMATLSNISQSDYRYPFSQWDNHKPYGQGSRMQNAFLRMQQIGSEFSEILQEKGF